MSKSAEEKVTEFLSTLAVRVVDLIERECAVEDGRDHHVALVMIAAGNLLLVGLPDMLNASISTAGMLPKLLELASDEAIRRQNERDSSMH